MQEPQKKGIREILKKIKEGVSGAERTFHGNLGRGVLDAADKLGSKLPKALQPDEYSPEDMTKAMQIWKEQGMGKIGNKPDADRISRNKAYFESNNYDTPKKQRDLIRNRGISSFPDYNKSDKVDGVMSNWRKQMEENMNPYPSRVPPTQAEIAAGRSVTLGGAAGASAAAAHSYWTQKKNENK